VQPALADELLDEDCREQRVGGAQEVGRHERPAPSPTIKELIRKNNC